MRKLSYADIRSKKQLRCFFKNCIKSDDTGYFFKVADADISSLEGNEHIYYVDDFCGKYAIEVDSFK